MASRTEKTYALLASHIAAYHNCKASGNTEWLNRHADAVERICKQILPSGSGIDSGSTIDLGECTAEKIVIHADYHHMNDGGYYDGWTEHAIRVTPSFIGGLSLRVSGRDRNMIKDYLSDTFHQALTEDVIESWDAEREQYDYTLARFANSTASK